jgi:hypothetical protein
VLVPRAAVSAWAQDRSALSLSAPSLGSSSTTFSGASAESSLERERRRLGRVVDAVSVRMTAFFLVPWWSFDAVLLEHVPELGVLEHQRHYARSRGFDHGHDAAAQKLVRVVAYPVR